MKLIEAIQAATAPEDGPAFYATLACGFTPLHLKTVLKAHLRRRLPDRSVLINTGMYGDLAGLLESGKTERHDCIFVVLEWADLDPRLSWRSIGPISRGVLEDVRTRLDRIVSSIVELAARVQIMVTLPALPLPPVFHTPTSELHQIEAQLKAMVYDVAGSIPAVVLQPDRLPAAPHDLRSELMTGFPYSFAYADGLAASLVHAALPLPSKKGLISDLDETMWQGVLGDDGPEGVSWDLDRRAAFHGAYQHVLNSLAEMGVLVGVASKNDEELVQKVLKRPDLVIRPEYLFPIEAHWKPKIESIERTLRTWNIASDSVLFVDDNPIELEQVKTAFPAIECVQFRKDDPSFLQAIRDHFAKRSILAEDVLRVGSLRAGEVLRQASTDAGSLEALLAGANAKLLFRWGKQSDPRALELINKTNQFNLNGKRYTEADWRNFLADPTTRLAIVEYEDRFGKLGKIAVIAGRETDDDGFSLETWVMSCRAFSRRIEHQCLKVLLERWDPIRLRFAQTDRNGPLQDFLTQVAPGDLITRREFDDRCPELFHKAESTDA